VPGRREPEDEHGSEYADHQTGGATADPGRLLQLAAHDRELIQRGGQDVLLQTRIT
jgi:hypothetical protein